MKYTLVILFLFFISVLAFAQDNYELKCHIQPLTAGESSAIYDSKGDIISYNGNTHQLGDGSYISFLNIPNMPKKSGVLVYVLQTYRYNTMKLHIGSEVVTPFDEVAYISGERKNYKFDMTQRQSVHFIRGAAISSYDRYFKIEGRDFYVHCIVGPKPAK